MGKFFYDFALTGEEDVTVTREDDFGFSVTREDVLFILPCWGRLSQFRLDRGWFLRFWFCHGGEDVYNFPVPTDDFTAIWGDHVKTPGCRITISKPTPILARSIQFWPADPYFAPLLNRGKILTLCSILCFLLSSRFLFARLNYWSWKLKYTLLYFFF